MKKLSILVALLTFIIIPQLAYCEIYSWIDEYGVKQFSNEPPPEGVKTLYRTKEIPYDKAKDRQREESDKASQKTENTAPESDKSDTVIIQEADDDDTYYRERIVRPVKKKHIRKRKKMK